MDERARGSLLGDLMTAIVALSALSIAVVVVRREILGKTSSTSLQTVPDRQVPDWGRIVGGGHRIGPPGAAITIVEFGDYQCPACRRFHRSLAGALAEYPEQVSVVYRHLPLEDIHPVAYQAAKAAICAASQGRFERLHELLYAQQDSIGRKSLSAFGAEAGVTDSAGFVSCLNSADRVQAIDADIQLARELGLRGTPSVAINGVLYGSPPDSLRLQALIREHLSSL